MNYIRVVVSTFKTRSISVRCGFYKCRRILLPSTHQSLTSSNRWLGEIICTEVI